MKTYRLLDINAATAEQIDGVEAVRGHGFEIVRYREERGGFADLRRLDEVPGLTGKAEAARASLTTGR